MASKINTFAWSTSLAQTAPASRSDRGSQPVASKHLFVAFDGDNHHGPLHPAETVPSALTSARSSCVEEIDAQNVYSVAEEHSGETLLFPNTPEFTPYWRANRCFSSSTLS